MENSDADDLDANELSCCIYPIDGSPPKSAKIFYREWIENHGGKIPNLHTGDREFICDLFLRDVKIREKLKEFVTKKSMREKLSNLFL